MHAEIFWHLSKFVICQTDYLNKWGHYYGPWLEVYWKLVSMHYVKWQTLQNTFNRTFAQLSKGNAFLENCEYGIMAVKCSWIRISRRMSTEWGTATLPIHIQKRRWSNTCPRFRLLRFILIRTTKRLPYCNLIKN